MSFCSTAPLCVGTCLNPGWWLRLEGCHLSQGVTLVSKMWNDVNMEVLSTLFFFFFFVKWYQNQRGGRVIWTIPIPYSGVLSQTFASKQPSITFPYKSVSLSFRLPPNDFTRCSTEPPGDSLCISHSMSLKNLLSEQTIPVTVVVLVIRFTSPAYFQLEMNLNCSGGEQD